MDFVDPEAALANVRVIYFVMQINGSLPYSSSSSSIYRCHVKVKEQ